MSFAKFFGHPCSIKLTKENPAKYFGKDAIDAVYLHPEDLSRLKNEFNRLVGLVETDTLSVIRPHFLKEIEKFLADLKEEVIPPDVYKSFHCRYKKLCEKRNEQS